MPGPSRKKPDRSPDEEDPLVSVDISKTVKTYLSTHIRVAKIDLLEYIERTVQVVSQLAKKGSFIFHAAIHKACESGEPFQLELKEVQTLFNQSCFMDENASRVRAPKGMTKWIVSAFKDAPDAYSLIGPSMEQTSKINGTFLTQVVTSHAVKYRTNLVNHLWVPFEIRVGSYLKGTWAIEEPSFKWPKGGFSTALAFFFQGAPREEKARRVLPGQLVDFVRRERAHLLQINGEEADTVVVDKDWIEEHLPATLRFHYRILSFWDDVRNKHGDQIRRKPFTLAPIHQTRRLFIDIDSTAFFHLLKALKLLPERAVRQISAKDVNKERKAARELYVKKKLDEWNKEREKFEEKFKKKNGPDNLPRPQDYPKKLQQAPSFLRVKLPETSVTEDSWTDFDWFKRKQEHLLWRQFFDVEEPVERKAPGDVQPWKFGDHISTDGVALCLLYKKTLLVRQSQKARVLKRKELEPTVYQANLKETLKDKRVWYVDPGRTNIVTAYRFEDPVGPLNDGPEIPTVAEKVQYGRREYYSDAGITRANLRRREWNKSWLEDEAVKQFHKEHSFRTASYEAWKAAVKEYSKVHALVWTETSQQRHSMLSMKTYQGKQSALMRFWNGLSKTPEERLQTAVVYGVCYRSMASGGRGEVSVPVKAAHLACRRCYTVYDLDEHCTTKLCALCGGELQMVYKERNDSSKITLVKKNVKIHGEVRGLKCCRNPRCVQIRKTCLVDRDGNSCWNFWFLSMSPTRPPAFSRTKTEI